MFASTWQECTARNNWKTKHRRTQETYGHASFPEERRLRNKVPAKTGWSTVRVVAIELIRILVKCAGVGKLEYRVTNDIRPIKSKGSIARLLRTNDTR